MILLGHPVTAVEVIFCGKRERKCANFISCCRQVPFTRDKNV
jgi:hypothetical protein